MIRRRVSKKKPIKTSFAFKLIALTWAAAGGMVLIILLFEAIFGRGITAI